MKLFNFPLIFGSVQRHQFMRNYLIAVREFVKSVHSCTLCYGATCLEDRLSIKPTLKIPLSFGHNNCGVSGQRKKGKFDRGHVKNAKLM